MKYLKYVLAILILILLVVWATPVLFIDHVPDGTLVPNHDESYIPEILLTPVPTRVYDIEEYTINSYSSDIDMRRILDALQVAYDSGYYNSFNGDEPENNIIEYITDFPSVAGSVGLKIVDTTYSLMETAFIDNKQYGEYLCCDKFDCEENAARYYKDVYVDKWIIYRDYNHQDMNIINNSDKGYCIRYSEGRYTVAYLINDTVIYYNCSLLKLTNDEFNRYLEFCSILDLPTDETVNEEVYNSIKYNR